MTRTPPFPEWALREAVESNDCWADTLRALGYETKGSNFRTVQRWVTTLELDTSHFNGNNARSRAGKARAMPLEACLVENSTYARGKLKQRLLAAGLLQRECEMCGQGEIWRGDRLSLILDHINGVPNDHRLENLRMLCPNCNATLDTHCGRNIPRERECAACGGTFVPGYLQHRYCSQACWGLGAKVRYTGVPHPETRKVDRPSYDQLKQDIAAMSMVKVGKKYGVSDNAVRKWLKWYQRVEDREHLNEAV